ncbi:MAG: MaoC family dehydratase [Pseudomonadota bacterium]
MTEHHHIPLAQKIGTEIGVSDWLTVSQEMINQFADVTDDHQFIHVDPERAKDTPFGGTIAHGFLTLSLLSTLAKDLDLQVPGMVAGVNYGFDKVRMVRPVPAGSEIRGRFILAEVSKKAPGQWLMRLETTVEVKGAERPAIKASWLIMQFTEDDQE